MSDSEGDADLALGDVFTEPPRPPSPDPTVSMYTRDPKDGLCNKSNSWSNIEIRLVGSHPLWGHYLWNASRAFASYLDTHPELYRGRTVLELGAGGGLPGIVAAKNGAVKVIMTDYPDASLIENLHHNLEQNISPESVDCVAVRGYIWGHPIEPLLELLPQSPSQKFDLIIMSDLIFNHSQHNALLRTCEAAISQTPGRSDVPDPCLLVFYSHHRPHLAHRDMQFFDKARERGWLCEEILTQKFPPMFPEDPGEEEVRATVHGWRLTLEKPS